MGNGRDPRGIEHDREDDKSLRLPQHRLNLLFREQKRGIIETVFLHQPGSKHPAGESMKRLLLTAGRTETNLHFLPVTGSPTCVELFFLTDQFHEMHFLVCLLVVVCQFQSASCRYRMVRKSTKESKPAPQQ